MDLKLRKRIQNGALPRFANGTLLDQANDITTSAGQQTIHPSMFTPDDITKDVLKANVASKVRQPIGVVSKFAGIGDKIGGVATSAINFVNTIGDVSTNKYTSDEMMGSGGTVNETANGVGYQEQSVDSNGIQSQIDATAKAGTMSGISSGAALGGSIGSVIPGVGTAIGTVGGAILGGIFGGLGSSKAKREAERQKMIAINRTNALNTQNREMAYTTGLRNRFARENVTDDTQSLFHAAEGIEGDVDPATRTTRHKHLADTAKYGTIMHKVNSMGNKGETMVSGESDKNGMHNVHGIDRGPNDTAPMYLTQKDDVFSNKFIDWETGLPISLAVRLNAEQNGGKISTRDKQRYEMNQNIERMLTYTGKRKQNKLPRYIGGTEYGTSYLDYLNGGPLGLSLKDVPADIPAPASTETPKPAPTGKKFNIGKRLGKAWNWLKGVGNGTDWSNLSALANAYMIAARRDARAQGLRAPKSFTPTSGLNAALQGLGRLRSNYYPVWAQNREIESRGASAIAQSGLNAGQRMLGYMGLANQTQQTNANALFSSQNNNNALASQYYKSLISANQEEARRGQQAYQWDEDMLAKAHAAREGMYGTSDYDRQNAWLSYLNNRFKKNQFDQVMALYRSQADIDTAKTRAIINNLAKGV